MCGEQHVWGTTCVGNVFMLGLLAVLGTSRPLPDPPSPGPSGCAPGQFRCEEPHGECFPREWICDGHPDCMDERDERGCEASGSPAGPGAAATEASATPVPGHTLPSRSQGCTWVLIIAGIFCCEAIRWD
uniref:Uncharacterized protein n=1 Tax=Anas platyrhynchos platyrhynchos TaxID=8840 RepID=A0A493TUG5_ANAPP